MPNRLADETSPYLRQHADNPVDWYPWGDEPFERAKRENKPVFLSAGYSACHWCHVMERESFEDDTTAALLNEHFVCVKVDREERPDVDSVYMDAVQSLTGHGGWPMTVFLTPDKEPFYGGTYFPAKPRAGIPSFREVLTRIVELWQRERDDLLHIAGSLTEALREQIAAEQSGGGIGAIEPETIDLATSEMSAGFDARHGGWGSAPKFPQPSVLEFLLRRHFATGDERLLGMVTRTLDAMMRGGIYDQLGGGFHRYSTDEQWLVPHFEKMLYDNAQLARVYIYAWQVTREPDYRRVAEETLDYILREMTDAAGGFYSAQDADTDGREGVYYTWTPDEIRAAARADAGAPSEDDVALFLQAFGVSERGQLEGRSVLRVAETPSALAMSLGISPDEVVARLDRVRLTLLRARGERPQPAVDDKVLAGWNGLALSAFALAARVFGRPEYGQVAERNAHFVLERMRSRDGRLLRTLRAGRARLNAYLEDQAFYAAGLIDLYETTFDPRYFSAALELCNAILAHFADEDGGFFDTADDHEQLLLRPKDLEDLTVPSAGSVAADVCAKMAEYTGGTDYSAAAEGALLRMEDLVRVAPQAFARWLSVIDFVLSPPQAVAIVGPHLDPMVEVVNGQYRPNTIVAATAVPGGQPEVPLLEGRERSGTCAYVCSQLACGEPACTPDDLERVLGGDVLVGAGRR